MAPSWVKFNVAYRNKSHILKISIARVSAESFPLGLHQEFTTQEMLLSVSIPTVQSVHFLSKHHIVYLNVINCNKYYATKAKKSYSKKRTAQAK